MASPGTRFPGAHKIDALSEDELDAFNRAPQRGHTVGKRKCPVTIVR